MLLLNDWRHAVQSDHVSKDSAATDRWRFVDSPDGRLLEAPTKGVVLPQLTYPLDLAGRYAIYVLLPPPNSVRWSYASAAMNGARCSHPVPTRGARFCGGMRTSRGST